MLAKKYEVETPITRARDLIHSKNDTLKYSLATILLVVVSCAGNILHWSLTLVLSYFLIILFRTADPRLKERVWGRLYPEYIPPEAQWFCLVLLAALWFGVFSDFLYPGEKTGLYIAAIVPVVTVLMAVTSAIQTGIYEVHPQKYKKNE